MSLPSSNTLYFAICPYYICKPIWNTLPLFSTKFTHLNPREKSLLIGMLVSKFIAFQYLITSIFIT